MIIDTFPINNELDMLEMRLETMSPAVDWFIAVEADVDHQDHPKPYWISDNIGRFVKWADKLIIVQATGLPTHEEDPDPWARELAQREYVHDGLREIDERVGLSPSDIVLHGDVDEICRPLYVRNVRPKPPLTPTILPDNTLDLGFVSSSSVGISSPSTGCIPNRGVGPWRGRWNRSPKSDSSRRYATFATGTCRNCTTRDGTSRGSVVKKPPCANSDRSATRR